MANYAIPAPVHSPWFAEARDEVEVALTRTRAHPEAKRERD